MLDIPTIALHVSWPGPISYISR